MRSAMVCPCEIVNFQRLVQTMVSVCLFSLFPLRVWKVTNYSIMNNLALAGGDRLSLRSRAHEAFQRNAELPVEAADHLKR